MAIYSEFNGGRRMTLVQCHRCEKVIYTNARLHAHCVNCNCKVNVWRYQIWLNLSFVKIVMDGWYMENGVLNAIMWDDEKWVEKRKINQRK